MKNKYFIEADGFAYVVELIDGTHCRFGLVNVGVTFNWSIPQHIDQLDYNGALRAAMIDAGALVACDLGQIFAYKAEGK